MPLPSDCRNPVRWRRVTQCRTARNFKQNILQVCDSRGDSLARSVRVRVNGALSDLHAADGQYHRDCYKSFISHGNVRSARTNVDHDDDDTGNAVIALVGDMTEDKAHVWNTVEVEELNVSYGGYRSTRRHQIEQLSDHFGTDLLDLRGKGVASLLVFRSKASRLMKLVDDDSDDDLEVINMAKIIVQECNQRAAPKNTYDVRLSLDNAADASSPVVMKLLSALCPKLSNTNAAILIGNMITSIVTNRPTTL